MVKIDFEFSVIGERSEYENIGPKSNDNIFDAQIELIQDGKYFTEINFYIYSGIPFCNEDYLKIVKPGDSDVLAEKIQINTISDDHIIDIDFSASRVTNVSLKRDYKNSEYGLTVISLSEISFHYENKTGLNNIAIFHLDDSAYKLVNQYYSFLKSEDNTTWNAKYTNAPIQKLGFEFTWRLDFKIDQKKYHNKEIIHKVPLLQIQKIGDIDECDLLDISKLILGLASFFRNENITYHQREIYQNPKKILTYFIAEDSSGKQDGVLGGLIHYGYRGNFHKFLQDANFPKLLPNHADISQIIKRFVFSKFLEAETKFLLLYNLLERLKSICVDETTSKKEFTFSIPKNKINKKIREKLLAITEFVKEEEKDDFRNQVVNHIKTIKYKKMINQFDPLFDKFHQDFDKSELSQLVKLRNSIVHGGKISQVEDVNRANRKLKIILGVLITNISIEG